MAASHHITHRAGKMIPEVEGTRPWGPSRKRVPKCLKGPKTTYTTIEVADKQSKRSKKGPFSLYIRSPRSHPGDGITGARRGRSLPVHPGFSSHDYTHHTPPPMTTDHTFHMTASPTPAAARDIPRHLYRLITRPRSSRGHRTLRV